MASCEYTDIQPKGVTYANDITALRGLLNGNYDNYASGYAYYMLDDMQVPDGFQIGTITNPTLDNAYNFEDYICFEDKSDGSLNKLLSELNNMNVILDNINDSEGSQGEIDLLTNTALVRRAHIYYSLINTYCPQYTEAVASQPNTGWSLKFSEDYDCDLTRSTLQELYDRLIADLLEAEQIELPRNIYTTYGSTEAAQGLLAMYYMSMGDYNNALEYCNKALGNYNVFLDYKSFDPTNVISGIMYNNAFNPEMILNRYNYMSIYNTVSSQSRSHAYMSPELINLFDKTNDLRWEFAYTTDAITYQWMGVSSSGLIDLSCTVPLLMLYQAECEARIGSYSTAMTIINNLRANRFRAGSDYMLTAANKEEAIALILEEAHRELRFTMHRYSYIRRLNTLHNANISINRKGTNGKQISIPANDPKWTQAIPRYYVDLSPEIIQNPR